MDSKRLLLVDPSAGFADALGPLLARERFDVEHVHSSASVIELVQKRQFHGICVGLPVLAPEIPDLMSAIRRELSASRRAAVLMTTNDESSTDARIALESGVNALVQWPSASHAIVDRLSGLLDISPRKDIRVVMNLSVVLDGRTKKSMCQSENVSISGILLKTSETLPIGTDLDLEFGLPSQGERVSIRARVVRITHSPRERVRGIGLRSLEFRGDSEARLETYLMTQ